MRILIVCARFPDRQGKGDQQRALQLAQLLARDHEVSVLTGAGPGSPAHRAELEATGAILLPLKLTAADRAAGAARAALEGLPLQVGWMTPPRAYAGLRNAAAGADAVIAVTIRCLPIPLPAPTILDHVDALSANMRARARLERRAPARAAAARLEARRLARHERRAARWVIAQTVVSPLDAAVLPPQPPLVVLPLAVELGPLAVELGPLAGGDDSSRDIDVIFTGDMRYPPNRDAAVWLACEIAPRLVAAGGGQGRRIVIAGRGAATLAPLPHVELLSDVPDIGALLRRARVAAVPLRAGTGTPIKLHEAAAAGAAVVSTPWVAEAIAAEVDTAADARGFATAIETLLTDEALRRARVAATRASLERSSPEAVRHALAALLANVNIS